MANGSWVVFILIHLTSAGVLLKDIFCLVQCYLKWSEIYSTICLQELMLVHCSSLVHTFMEWATGRNPHKVNHLLVV
jgi:hypothetical protein